MIVSFEIDRIHLSARIRTFFSNPFLSPFSFRFSPPPSLFSLFLSTYVINFLYSQYIQFYPSVYFYLILITRIYVCYFYNVYFAEMQQIFLFFSLFLSCLSFCHFIDFLRCFRFRLFFLYYKLIQISVTLGNMEIEHGSEPIERSLSKYPNAVLSGQKLHRRLQCVQMQKKKWNGTAKRD